MFTKKLILHVIKKNCLTHWSGLLGEKKSWFLICIIATDFTTVTAVDAES